MNKNITKLFCMLLLMNVILLSASCNKDPKDTGLEYMPDMYRSPSYETYSTNMLFADSSSARLPAVGTVPRNYTFFHYPSSNEGYEAAGRDVKNPLPSTDANLEEGKRLYGNYCNHCHGAAGNGDGSLIATGKFPPPPSYANGVSSRGGKMRDLTDGKIFHTITYGVNLMGSHASQVNPEERWKIVMYVHHLANTGAANASTDSTTVAPKDSTVVMNK
jgi:mono/diheme cytochrome c family protein